jgi:hypothetical protein
MRNILAVLAVVVLVGCDNPFGGDDPPTMTGAWRTDSGDIRMTLRQDGDGTFVGAGTIRYARGGDLPMEVRGVNSHPSVSMSIIDRDGFALNFRGDFSGGDALVGMMSGYSNGSFSYTFRRE